jgi:hypothetical protein
LLQRIVIRDNTLIFMFHDKDFFGSALTGDDDNDDAGAAAPEKFGRVLFVDLEKVSPCHESPLWSTKVFGKNYSQIVI